jgi:hypothetical protein
MFFRTRCDSDWITAVATCYVPTKRQKMHSSPLVALFRIVCSLQTLPSSCNFFNRVSARLIHDVKTNLVRICRVLAKILSRQAKRKDLHTATAFCDVTKRILVHLLPTCTQFLCCSMYCFVSFCILFVCKRVLNYCHRMATQLQLIISYQIKTNVDNIKMGHK